MFYLILLIAVVIDCREHRIPNWLIGLGLLLGLSYSVILPVDSIAMSDAAVGALVGFLVLLPGYVLGKMGAGDVKLMAVCGCYLGAAGVVNAALMTFIAGGVLGLLWVALDRFAVHPLVVVGRARYLSSAPVELNQAQQSPSAWKQRFPYAAAIAVGCLTIMLTEFSVFPG